MADTPIKIMVFAAHPQDPFERTGGTVAKHLARGDQAMFVSLTAGVVTHAFNTFPPTGDDKLRDIENVKSAKREEFERAARVLGLTDWRALDFNESPLLVGLDETIVLVDLIREFRPDVVLTHHPVEVGRHDHMDCGRCAIAAVDYARADGFPSPLAPHTAQLVYVLLSRLPQRSTDGHVAPFGRRDRGYFTRDQTKTGCNGRVWRYAGQAQGGL